MSTTVTATIAATSTHRGATTRWSLWRSVKTATTGGPESTHRTKPEWEGRDISPALPFSSALRCVVLGILRLLIRPVVISRMLEIGTIEDHAENFCFRRLELIDGCAGGGNRS